MVKQTGGKRCVGDGTPGPGRPKGSKNKATAALKDAILNAFNTVGGEAYLAVIAKSDPKTFCTLLGRVLPLTLDGEVNHNVEVTVTIGGHEPSREA